MERNHSTNETESPAEVNAAPRQKKAIDIVIDDSDRYSRLQLIGWWDQARVSAARIMVVGAGALGNEVLKNLALLGLGQIYIIDFDHVQGSNLSRSVLFRAEHEGLPKSTVAAEMAGQLNPDCQIVPIVGDVLTEIGLGLVRDLDLVICCVDNREARLWINRMCWKSQTPWIDGGIQEINGVAKVFVPPAGSCYECTMTDNDYRLISLRYSCPLLKQEDIQMGKVPTAPTIASIIAGLQVQEALKLIHKLPSAEGTALVFNGAANKFYQTRYPRREDCLSHETYEPITEMLMAAEETTPNRLFEELSSSHGILVEDMKLVLDRDFLANLTCRSCQTVVAINQPLCKVGSRDGICDACQQPLHAETTCEISHRSILADRTLRSLGVPDYDIVKVMANGQTLFVLLAGDQDKIGEFDSDRE